MTNFADIKRRFDILYYIKDIEHVDMIPPGLRGAIIGILTRACGGNENRQLVQRALTGYTSSRDFSAAHWYVIKCFVGPYVNPLTNQWEGRQNLEQLCRIVLEHVVDQPGQMKMFSAKEREKQLLHELGYDSDVKP